MAHFALICPPFASHIHSLSVLGEELVRRGHRATFVLNAEAEAMVKSAVLGCETVAGRSGDPAVGRVLANATRPAGLFGTLRTIAESAAMTAQLCAGAPELLRRIGCNAVIADQLEPAGGLLALGLGLPLVSLATALPINSGPGVPLPFLDWPFDPSPRGVRRARVAVRIGGLLSRRQNRVIEACARRLGIDPPCRSMEDCLSPMEQIAQLVCGYDFPRPEPVPFVGVGPLRHPEEERGDEVLPFAFAPERPLVFASFGTLQGGRVGLFRAIAGACRDAGADLLVAHGGKLDEAEAAGIGATFVTDFVPYRAVLKRAALCVTHGGSNTVLDALACGVPLLVRPVAFDQKGNAARIVHHRLGERIDLRRLPEQIGRLVADEGYRRRARTLAGEIAAAGGRTRAADIVEATLNY
ncbi:glycosyltransferase [uncultured Sphingomonas sp.]|uniref:glycosyltransferase n=1 Tax=uncultured Sphingomonas sp. TaxID=158754 RepID=UPI0025E9C233|nr:glycosyltransferase [uncultured Sphingomonas sp.]